MKPNRHPLSLILPALLLYPLSFILYPLSAMAKKLILLSVPGLREKDVAVDAEACGS